MSRREIQRLAGDRLPNIAIGPKKDVPMQAPAIAGRDGATAGQGERPVVPPGVPQFFAPDGAGSEPWRPVLYGAVQVRFSERPLKLNFSRLLTLVTPITDGAVPVDWHDAEPTTAAVEENQRRLEEQFDAETASIVSPAEALTEVLEPVAVSLKKTNVRVKAVALVWVRE